MARISTSDRLDQIHADAIKEFDAIQKAARPERMQSLSDRRFYSISGAQWEGAIGDQFENKPRFEFNHVHLAVIRIINEYRANRITVDFQTPDGSDDDEMADTCDGLYRADEKASTANEAYDNAYEEAVGGGFGAFRLRATYENMEDEENDRQRVVFEPIYDADASVFFDLAAKRQDKADAKRCYVLTPWPIEAYKDEFGDDPTDWPKSISGSEFDWSTPELVWVCELFKVEERKELIRWFKGLDDSEMRVPDQELKDNPDKLPQLLATGFRQVREKRVERRVVHKYLLSGGRVLEDCGLIAGRCIPIIPVYGKRWVVDGVERFMGHVRLAKDAQRLSNMLMSWLAEMAARFDIEKPIVSPEQVAGHAQMWADDNIKKYPYLLLNAITDSAGNAIPQPPLAYTKAPQVPPAMAALTQLAQQALTDLLGNQQAGEEVKEQVSGKAIELIQNRLDMQTFIYMSNFAKAMKRSGEVWLSMMKDIAVEPNRRMKTLTDDGKASSVELNQPAYDPEKGREYVRNDISAAHYEVDVDVGPNSSSLRSAVVRALTGIANITQDPETQQALTLATIANLEGEGLQELRDWGRAKAIRMGLIKPTDDEKAELATEQQNQKPDPQAEYLQAEAAKAQALTVKAKADTFKVLADTEKAKADTAATLAGIDQKDRQQAIDAAAAFQRAAIPPGGGL
jgi:Phage P22-like portal protein